MAHRVSAQPILRIHGSSGLDWGWGGLPVRKAKRPPIMSSRFAHLCFPFLSPALAIDAEYTRPWSRTGCQIVIYLWTQGMTGVCIIACIAQMSRDSLEAGRVVQVAQLVGAAQLSPMQ